LGGEGGVRVFTQYPARQSSCYPSFEDAIILI